MIASLNFISFRFDLVFYCWFCFIFSSYHLMPCISVLWYENIDSINNVYIIQLWEICLKKLIRWLLKWCDIMTRDTSFDSKRERRQMLILIEFSQQKLYVLLIFDIFQLLTNRKFKKVDWWSIITRIL